MVTLSFIFVIFAISGLALMFVAGQKDEFLRKLGIYIFFIGFLLFALQLQIDYPIPSEQGDSTGVLLLAISLLILVLLFDLLKVMTRAAELINSRR